MCGTGRSTRSRLPEREPIVAGIAEAGLLRGLEVTVRVEGKDAVVSDRQQGHKPAAADGTVAIVVAGKDGQSDGEIPDLLDVGVVGVPGDAGNDVVEGAEGGDGVSERHESAGSDDDFAGIVGPTDGEIHIRAGREEVVVPEGVDLIDGTNLRLVIDSDGFTIAGVESGPDADFVTGVEGNGNHGAPLAEADGIGLFAGMAGDHVIEDEATAEQIAAVDIAAAKESTGDHGLLFDVRGIGGPARRVTSVKIVVALTGADLCADAKVANEGNAEVSAGAKAEVVRAAGVVVDGAFPGIGCAEEVARDAAGATGIANAETGIAAGRATTIRRSATTTIATLASASVAAAGAAPVAMCRARIGGTGGGRGGILFHGVDEAAMVGDRMARQHARNREVLIPGRNQPKFLGR